MFYKKDETGYKVVMDGVRLKTLVYGEKTLQCEFRIERGKGLPSHSHPHEQTGYLISGRMRFIIADERHDVQPEIAGVSRAMWSTPQRPLRTRWGLRSSPLSGKSICPKTCWHMQSRGLRWGS